METLTQLLAQHGVILLFGVGFLEFIGAPFAGVPALVVAGGLAAMGGVPLPLIVLGAVSGGLLADLIWYTTARLRGQRLVDTVCGLTSNPKACIVTVQQRVVRLGARFLVPSKFIPGAGNLAAAAAGFVPVPVAAFLVADALGVLAWASVYTGLGWIFSHQVEAVIEWASRLGTWLLVGAAILLAAIIAGRVAAVRRHRKRHGTGSPMSLETDPPTRSGYRPAAWSSRGKRSRGAGGTLLGSPERS